MVKRIGILTSGGDAPGMNSVINRVVTLAAEEDVEVRAYLGGYVGLIEDNWREVPVSEIKLFDNVGGTIIGSARTNQFKDEAVRQAVVDRLHEQEVDALIVIGGDGSYRGAQGLINLDFPVVAIPGTIDNDIPATEVTLGFKTAIHNVVTAVDMVTTSAASHGHNFAIEVMGRRAGDIALWTGIALDADVILTEYDEFQTESYIKLIDHARQIGKKYTLSIIAEGAMTCEKYKELIEEKSDYKIHPLLLGHIQRGGTTATEDRILGKMFGQRAFDYLINGGKGCCLAVEKNSIVEQDINEALATSYELIRPFNF
ncbi:ATP-dependent 6-phosphofructokinase [Hutsoniella sourekii]|uniref:ATP-dependent 6-phosphofructokinase n=1 Tax=Hutsoniella sourekii TaxID=87650 RepID=UPI0004AEC2C6|nr:ATP-dependent 6-phosphofructokinase [Hutsoniella sourekii]